MAPLSQIFLIVLSVLSTALAAPAPIPMAQPSPAIEARHHWKHYYSNVTEMLTGGPSATSGYPVPTASGSGFPIAYGYEHTHHEHRPHHDANQGYLRQAFGLSGII